MRTVQVENNGTRLYTFVHENSEKETVILLHGGPGVPEGMAFVARFLAKHYQVISFHQRGTLQSPCPSNDYSMEAYVSDINSIADYFKLQKFHLFGHSWGGLYAQLYAQQHPERLLSLFLCSPGSGTGLQWQEMMLEIAKYIKSKCRGMELLTMGAYSAFGLWGFDKGHRKFYAQTLKNFSRGFKQSHQVYFALECIKAKAINQTLKEIIKYPVPEPVINPPFSITITYGDGDIFGDSIKYVLQRYPTARTITIPNSGHMPWSHNEAEFIKILKEHYRM